MADHGPGKIADLAIVNGRPAERITDLRRTERVIVPDACTIRRRSTKQLG